MNFIPLVLNLMIFGFFLTYYFKLKLFFEERLWTGLLLGMVIFAFYSLFSTSFVGLNPIGTIFFLIVINLLAIFIFIKASFHSIRHDLANFRQRSKHKAWICFFITVAIFVFIFSYLASQLLIKKDGRLFVQPVHSYGDISLHLGIISAFAYGNNFPPQSPILAGTPISYPFLFDFITALFISFASLSIEQAVAVTGILMTAVVILSLTYIGLIFAKSRLTAVLFLIIFVFNGGFGFITFVKDLHTTNWDLFNLLTHLQKDYTALKDIGYQWINVVISMFLPQRGFLLGLSVGLLILRIFWQLSEEYNRRSLVLGSILFSLLPIIHAHTMIALTPFLIWLGLKFLIKNFQEIRFVSLIGILVVFIIFTLSRTFLGQAENPLEHIKLQIGWMAHGEDLINFYLKNFGLTLILLPFMVLIGIKHRLKLASFATIGLIWFILPSIFIFQPWEFDNTKLFIYWYLSASLLIAHYLSKLLTHQKFRLSLFAILSLFLLTLSGGLDITRLLTSSNTRFEVYSPQAIKFSEFVKSNIPKKAVILAVDKFDNPAVALAGRKVVVGYHGWLWTYGLDYSQKEQDVRLMLAGQADELLFKKYKITNVIFFNEQNEYIIDKDYFYKRYPLIYSQDDYEVFAL